MPSVGHNYGTIHSTAVQNLVPSYHSLPPLAEKRIEMLDEIILEIIHTGKTQTVCQPVTIPAVPPCRLRTFVTSYMIIPGREKFQHFSEYIFEKPESPRTRAVDILHHSPVRTYFLRLVRCAGQPRISRYGCARMPRKLYFRDHGDESLGGIGHHVPDIILRIPPSMRPAVTRTVIAAGLRSPRPDLRQPRIFPDFYPPALVFRKMPVENILLVHGHHVQEPVDFFLGMKPPAAVHVHATPAVFGPVFYPATWKGPFSAGESSVAVDFCRKKLHDGLHGIEPPCFRTGRHGYLFRGYIQNVAFLRDRVIIQILHLRLSREHMFTCTRFEMTRCRYDGIPLIGPDCSYGLEDSLLICCRHLFRQRIRSLDVDMHLFYLIFVPFTDLVCVR